MSQQSRHFSLKVLTINIHKGFTAFNRRFILPELRDAVRTAGHLARADLELALHLLPDRRL
jgi:endonuclease/exonuclease/phosphatase family metal-dependent hydrolase